jgi:hypothetical protein
LEESAVTEEEIQALLDSLPAFAPEQLNSLQRAIAEEEEQRELEENAKNAALLDEFLERVAVLSTHLKPRQILELRHITKLHRPTYFTEHDGLITAHGFLGVFRALTGIWKRVQRHWGELEKGSFAWWLDAWIKQVEQQRLEAKRAAERETREMFEEWERMKEAS